MTEGEAANRVTVLIPRWADLERIVSSAQTSLWIATPYYSDVGISRVFDSLNSGVALHIVTSLSPSDWLRGYSDPLSLLALLELLADDGREANLTIHQRLHAKAYVADAGIALVGSANLSAGGFLGNFEICVRIEGPSAQAVVDLLTAEVAGRGRALTTNNLAGWVERHRESIENLRAERPSDPEELVIVQRDLDATLGFGEGVTPSRNLTLEDRDSFANWLAGHQDLAGASVLHDHFSNATGQNRQGHFRQSFFIASHFLDSNPHLQPQLAAELRTITEDPQLFVYDTAISDAWSDLLDANATEEGDHYSYPTLRNELTPNWGGTRRDGGGAGGTLKRMIRLLAEYREEN